MDQSSALNGVDVNKLSDKDKKELQQFIVNESQKARIQNGKFKFTMNFIFLVITFYPPDLHLHFVRTVPKGSSMTRIFLI